MINNVYTNRCRVAATDGYDLIPDLAQLSTMYIPTDPSCRVAATDGYDFIPDLAQLSTYTNRP